MKKLKVFAYAVLAGISIGIGATALLSVENRVVGTALFTVGLFCVCTFGFNLFTGKVCYVFERDKAYALDLPIIWVGNLVGTLLLAALEHGTRLGPTLTAKAAALCEARVNDTLFSLFLLGIFCNILIFIAVDCYGKVNNPVGKYLALFFGVMIFILVGSEHSVADMFYFSVAKLWNGDTFLRIIAISLGNAVGGVIFPLVRMWKEKGEK